MVGTVARQRMKKVRKQERGKERGGERRWATQDSSAFVSKVSRPAMECQLAIEVKLPTRLSWHGLGLGTVLLGWEGSLGVLALSLIMLLRHLERALMSLFVVLHW